MTADLFGRCNDCGHMVTSGGCVNLLCPSARSRVYSWTVEGPTPRPGADHLALLREAADALDAAMSHTCGLAGRERCALCQLIRRLREAAK